MKLLQHAWRRRLHCDKLMACAEPSSIVGRYTLHIIDLDPQSASANGWLEDVTKVKKYEMSDEDYNKRHDTFRKYREGKVKVRAFANSLMTGCIGLCESCMPWRDGVTAVMDRRIQAGLWRRRWRRDKDTMLPSRMRRCTTMGSSRQRRRA